MRFWLSPLLILLVVPGWSGDPRLPLLGGDARVNARTFDRLVADDPNQRRIGALEFLGGVLLTSPDPAFGGFSAMDVGDDGRFLLISDGGNIVRFTMDEAWRISDPSFADLTDGPRTGWEKRDRDSEAIAVDPTTGRTWIAFENANAIWRYDPTLTRSDGHVRPTEMRRWPRNGGAESLARLSDGRFVVLGETARWRRGQTGLTAALLFDGDPVEAGTRAFRFQYRPPVGFNATSAEPLDDGRIIVLNRRVAWPGGFEAVVTIVDIADIRPGAVVAGREVARFPGGLRSGFGRDNFEAMAVTVEDDATIIWLATDDNLQWPQRTLLLKFRLDDEAPAVRGVAQSR